MTELNPSISNNNINRLTPESLFSSFNSNVSFDLGGSIFNNECIQTIEKFIGKFRKISGNEGHTMNIELKNQGEIKNIFLKLSTEHTGHFAHLDDKYMNKINIQHSFGFATFTIDHSNSHMMEENHTDGENWMWEKEGPSLSRVNPSGIESISLGITLLECAEIDI